MIRAIRSAALKTTIEVLIPDFLRKTGAAETVVQRNLDSATQTQLVEDYINQVAPQRS